MQAVGLSSSTRTPALHAGSGRALQYTVIEWSCGCGKWRSAVRAVPASVECCGCHERGPVRVLGRSLIAQPWTPEAISSYTRSVSERGKRGARGRHHR